MTLPSANTAIEGLASDEERSGGYLNPLYARSFAHLGRPLHLPGSGAWLLERTVAGSSRPDAMGCYPLFCARDWRRLPEDLDSLRGKLVSVALVTDPFADVTPRELSSCFDLVIPFKEHFVVDLTQDPSSVVSRHHRRWAAKALKEVTVEVCRTPEAFLDDWLSLYSVLADRHSITGLRRFPPECLRIQLGLPGTVIFKARRGGELVGADWWMVQGDVVYGHLAAYNELGYQSRASYALLWTALRFFWRRAAWLHIGSGAGLESNPDDGLSTFKSGWATGTRRVYFCGKVLQPDAYSQLTRLKGLERTNYFPAYRQGEL